MITELEVKIFWDHAKRKVEYRTLKWYVFTIRGNTIMIPAGYQTDFASVPRWLWAFIPPVGRYNAPALVHDYLYDNRIGTRKEADKIFLDMMLQYGVHRWGALCMYWGVRIGGRRWWNE
jgi:hypothetical protein